MLMKKTKKTELPLKEVKILKINQFKSILIIIEKENSITRYMKGYCYCIKSENNISWPELQIQQLIMVV